MDSIQKFVQPTKKTYKKPEIRIYGDLREITQHVGATSTNRDAAPNPPYRTK